MTTIVRRLFQRHIVELGAITQALGGAKREGMAAADFGELVLQVLDRLATGAAAQSASPPVGREIEDFDGRLIETRFTPAELAEHNRRVVQAARLVEAEGHSGVITWGGEVQSNG